MSTCLFVKILRQTGDPFVLDHKESSSAVHVCKVDFFLSLFHKRSASNSFTTAPNAGKSIPEFMFLRASSRSPHAQARAKHLYTGSAVQLV